MLVGGGASEDLAVWTVMLPSGWTVYPTTGRASFWAALMARLISAAVGKRFSDLSSGGAADGRRWLIEELKPQGGLAVNP